MNSTDHDRRSPASRVSIDGNKIKYIRESKGLTQLYIATFLDVSPDTVSRWENKRYPTVKWENVEKLAEALEVKPDEILDQDDGKEKEKIADEQPGEKHFPFPVRSFYFLLAGLLLLLTGIVASIFYYSTNGKQNGMITATRFLPKHVPAGQPFPVIVRIDSISNSPFSFILQEKLPEHFIFLKGLPAEASTDSPKNMVKWIGSSQQSPFFLAYIVRAAPDSPAGTITFSGQIKADNAPRFQQDVTGDALLEISDYHWIDSNSDGVIDDEEILMVYSSADVLKRLGIDMEAIKKIWAAGKYNWNAKVNEYQILQQPGGDG